MTLQKNVDSNQKKFKLVENIQKISHDNETKISLQKSTSNLFRPRSREKSDTKINVSTFNQVQHIDTQNLVACVDGMTTYETLVDETLKYGLLPTVVPELKSITIGGAIAGCGIESSSYKYGLVHETVEEIEVLLGNGSLVKCTPSNEYKDLFFAFPNTFGTLGYALSVKVKLIPAKKYVKLTHYRFNTAKHFFEELNLLCSQLREAEQMAYIDGVIFGQNEMVITKATFVDEAKWLSDYTYRNIYYRSLLEKKEDYLKAKDYIWRWDPDWFWCSKVFFMQNPIVRALFGKCMLHSARYARIMHWFKKHPAVNKLFFSLFGEKESIIQDVAIPIDAAVEFYSFFQKEINISPIWICPTKCYTSNNKFDFCPMKSDTLYVDFGFWDTVAKKDYDGYYNRKIEKVSKELEGFKSLYSSCYYTEDEFWQLYDKNKYIAIKRKYDPYSHLRDLYAKCTTK